MTDQYYASEPTAASSPVPCAFVYRGHGFRMMTDAGVFSKGELDEGTRLLLDALPDLTGDVLDLGCGWGAIGVALARANPEARLTLADVNRRALRLAEENAAQAQVSVRIRESDGFGALADERFDTVVTNPPIRTGKAVLYSLFQQCHEHLEPGGRLYLVIRKQQGADSAKEYLSTMFLSVEVLARKKGFCIFCCKKTLGEK